MNVFYRIRYDDKDYRHEIQAHTIELAADGSRTAVYRRFLDPQANLQVVITQTSEVGDAVGKWSCVLHNRSDACIRLYRLDIGFALPETSLALDYFTSDWGSEFYPFQQTLTHSFSFGSVAGRSSKGFIPWAGLTGREKAWTVALAWSGCWNCEITPDPDNQKTWVSMGVAGEGFFTDLEPGGSFTAASLYLTEASSIESACLEQRRYFRQHLSLIPGSHLADVPLEWNSWWPYEDKAISEFVYQDNARLAKQLGCRYAMMDAGWFGSDVEGQNWYEKRGDWTTVNTRLFPSGMKAMCDQAKEIGILPGLWCEVEAVGVKAELHQQHPDLIARRDGRPLGYVCLGSQAGLDFAMETVDRILGEYGARWIKFDYNLDPAPGCNETGHLHGAGDGLYAHYRGYYRLLDQIHAKYPDVVIENCSSGGLRMDIEMLSHTTWTHLSDPDYTEFHLQCYWGALSYLHQSACLHFSWSQVLGEHNLGIRDPIDAGISRAHFDWIIRAALLGVPGFSYRLPEMPQGHYDRLKEHCDFYAGFYADYIRDGDVHRLTAQPVMGGKGERFPAFELLSAGQDAIVFAFRLKKAPSEQTVRLMGLQADAQYEVVDQDTGRTDITTGQALMTDGLTVSGLEEETSAVLTVKQRR